MYLYSGCPWAQKTQRELGNIREADLILIFEKAIRGGISGCMGKRYAVSVKEIKKLDRDSNDLYGRGLSQRLPCADKKFDNTVSTGKIVSTADYSDTGYELEVDLRFQKLYR